MGEQTAVKAPVAEIVYYGWFDNGFWSGWQSPLEEIDTAASEDRCRGLIEEELANHWPGVVVFWKRAHPVYAVTAFLAHGKYGDNVAAQSDSTASSAAEAAWDAQLIADRVITQRSDEWVVLAENTGQDPNLDPETERRVAARVAAEVAEARDYYRCPVFAEEYGAMTDDEIEAAVTGRVLDPEERWQPDPAEEPTVWAVGRLDDGDYTVWIEVDTATGELTVTT